MKKYTIRLLYDVEGWAYYWRCLALQKYAPQDFDVTIGSNYGALLQAKKHDLILQCAYSYAKDVKKFISVKLNYKPLLVSSFNVGWGYANTWLDLAIRDSDYVIINNYEMWNKYGKHPKTINISNGVDLDTFKIEIPVDRREHKVLWVGSIIHRKVKNYDSILCPLSNLLHRDKIKFEFRLTNSVGKNRLTHEQMCKWYNTGTIYAISSRNEGTPNPGLESSACGCIPVSTKVGNMPELIHDGQNGYLCETSVDSLYSGIKKAIKNYEELQTNMSSVIQTWGWKERSKQYYEYFRNAIENRK